MDRRLAELHASEPNVMGWCAELLEWTDGGQAA